jgi:hypothetical protein
MKKDEDELLGEIIFQIQKINQDLSGDSVKKVFLPEVKKIKKIEIQEDAQPPDVLDLNIFQANLKKLENEYLEITKKIQNLEKESKSISLDEKKQQNVQNKIDECFENLKHLKNEIFKRKYSEKAFYEYFFNRVQEPYPSISKEPKNRKNELNIFLQQFRKEENHWMIELNKITKKITGMENEKFIHLLQQKTEKLGKDEKNEKMLKEKLSLVQKRYKLLERSLKKYLSRKISKKMNKKKGIKIIENFQPNSFQLSILKANLREHEEMIDSLNQQINIPEDVKIKNIEPQVWYQYLKFDSMDELQKEKFLIHFEKKLFPSNLIIKNKFELNLRNNFMNLYPNVNFWNCWFQNRQLNEYANYLKRIGNLKMNSSFQYDFDIRNLMHQKDFNDDVHNLYFFNENHFDENFSYIFKEGSQDIIWKDSNSYFVYRKNQDFESSIVNLIGTRSDWLKVSKSRKILLKSIVDKDPMEYIRKNFDIYIYHLCCISSQRSMGSSFLSYFWEQQKKFIHEKSKETKEFPKKYDRNKEKLTKFLKQRVNDYLSEISISAFLVSSKILKKVEKYLSLIAQDPLKFHKKYKKSSGFKLKIYEFVHSCVSILHDEKKLKLNLTFLELSLRNRFISDFDFKSFNTIKLMKLILDEISNFKFISTVKNLPKMKKKKNEKESLIDLPSISNVIIQQDEESIQEKIKVRSNCSQFPQSYDPNVFRIKREDIDHFNEDQIKFLREK